MVHWTFDHDCQELFGSGGSMYALPNAPVQIFIWSESEDPADHQRAWATALVLMLFVLITSLVARLALARTRSKLGR